MYIHDNIDYAVRHDLSVFVPLVIDSFHRNKTKKKSNIVGVVHRPNSEPEASLDIFTTLICDIIEITNQNNLPATIMGDMNINLLNFQTHTKTNTYLENILSHGFLPTITMPTRIANSSATLIDHIYINETAKYITSGVIITDVSDHFGTFQVIQEKKINKRNSKSPLPT